MTLTELGSATPVGGELAAVNRVLPHDIVDPICYLKEAEVERKKPGIRDKIRGLFRRNVEERSFVAVNAEPDAIDVPLLAVNITTHGNKADIDIHAMSETARQDPKLVSGVVKLAMAECSVGEGIIKDGAADLPEELLERAFEPQHQAGMYAVHSALAA